MEKNFVWDRDPNEAYENPYEYEAQEQFLREATKVIELFFVHLMKLNLSFPRDEISAEKAIWMLHIDACDTLRDCANFLAKKKHRLIIRLFRDIIETLDLASYFNLRTEESDFKLNKWFDDHIIENKFYREHIEKNVNKEFSEVLKNQYRSFSKMVHRTYRVLCYNYILRIDGNLAYEGEFDVSLLPHPLSMCHAILANFVQFFAANMVDCELITDAEKNEIFLSSREEIPQQRRTLTPEEVYKRHLALKDK